MASKRRRKKSRVASPKMKALRGKAYRAKAFDTLMQQLKEKYPDRSTTGGPDGWLGDAKHAARSSDHNPRPPNGIVLGQDITHDPRHGFNSYTWCDMLISEGFRDERLRYCISNGRIAGNPEFCRSNPGYHLTPWKFGRYTGDNKHDKHCHLSLVRNEDLANDTRPWKLDGVVQHEPDAPEVEKRPTLRNGDEGEWVKQLQLKLGIEADGDFGDDTEDAVEDFQKSHGIKPDGVVGPYTWEALDGTSPKPVPEPPGPSPEPSPPPPGPSPEPAPTPTPEPPGPGPGDTYPTFNLINPGNSYNQKAINEVVENHPLANYDWPGRGEAPIGFLKGIASSFARAILFYRQKQEPWVSMARGETASGLDALNWYRNKFESAGMSNSKSGEDVIRHIFVLLLGLGMRESSGQYTEGRDASAGNRSGETTEGGMFQTSFNVRSRVPHLLTLFKMYKEADADILLDVYKEGVHGSPSRDWGDGPGREFQRLSKHSPDFAAQVAAIGIRSARDHWGPLNRRDAIVLKSANDMLKKVQDTLNQGALTS